MIDWATSVVAIESANREFLYGLREAGSSTLLAEPGFWSLLLLASGVAAAAAVAVRAMRRDQARGGPVVRHVARGLGINGGDRRLLDRMARGVGFRNACCTMISQGCFDHAAAKHIAVRGEAARLRALRGRLFDETAGN
jgi:hypothetical protein